MQILNAFSDSKELPSVYLNEANNRLVIDGDTTIVGEIAVMAGAEEIVIVGNGTLTLKSTEPTQPCIGSKTYTGMSFDRWSPVPCMCKKIIIDGVRVVCESNTPCFSLGAYNYENYPEVECCNGGSLECPEMTGPRFLKYKAFPPEGSTKISEYAVYVIGKENLYDEAQLELIEELHKYQEDLQVSYKVPVKALEEAIKLLKMNPACDITALVNGECVQNNMMARTICVLGMPSSAFTSSEMTFELTKLSFLRRTYKRAELEDADVIVRGIVHRIFGDDFSKLSDWDVEVIYEMIPSYCFNFDNSESHRHNVERFLDAGI